MEDLRRGFQGIFFMARGGWDGQIPDGTSDELFQSRWLVQGAEAAANRDGSIGGRKKPERDKYKEKFFPGFHAHRFSTAGRGLRTAVQTGEPPDYFRNWILTSQRKDCTRTSGRGC